MSNDADSFEVVCEPGVHAGWALRVDRFLGPKQQADTSRSYVSTTLAIEQVIGVQLEEYGTAVARVVHSFCGRDIHLRDGSRVEYRWELVVSDWRCMDCVADTDALGEYYMLRDELWEQVHPDNDGSLCIACVEGRLGRSLDASDFTDREINTAATFHRSPTLTDRLGRVPSSSV